MCTESARFGERLGEQPYHRCDIFHSNPLYADLDVVNSLFRRSPEWYLNEHVLANWVANDGPIQWYQHSGLHHPDTCSLQFKCSDYSSPERRVDVRIIQ